MVANRRKISRIQDKMKADAAIIVVKLGDLTTGGSALSRLAAQPLRAKTAFRISKILKAVSAELELCEAQRKALLDRLAYLPEGKDVQAWEFETDDKREEFEKEYQELLSTEVALSATKLNINEIDAVMITAGDLALLDWLFTE